MGFVLLPVLDAPLETVELLRDPYVLVVAADSPQAHGPTPTLREIGAEPLVGFHSDRSIEPVEVALHGAGLVPRFTLRSNDNGTVQGLVAAGVANAIMPRLTVDASDPQNRRARARRRSASARHRNRTPRRPLPVARRSGVHRDGDRERRLTRWLMPRGVGLGADPDQVGGSHRPHCRPGDCSRPRWTSCAASGPFPDGRSRGINHLAPADVKRGGRQAAAPSGRPVPDRVGNAPQRIQHRVQLRESVPDTASRRLGAAASPEMGGFIRP